MAAGISTPRLVADLATVTSPYDGSAPAEFVRIGSHVLFTAQPGDHARRLFRSDGTSSGTEEIASACGPLASGGFSLRFATAAQAFYSVRCGSEPEALWTSDGTPAGTRVLLPVGSYHSPGPQVPAPQSVEDGVGSFFLQGGDHALPLELWYTDGTVGGTTRIAIVSESDRVTGALHRRGAGDLLLLVAGNSEGLAVWKSDGTASGTRPVRVLAYPDQYTYLRSFHPTANGIAFMISAWPDRAELWYSDGTLEGTILGVGLTDYSSAPPTDHAGSVYFVSEKEGSEWVWRGDGTAESTRAIVPLGTRTTRSGSFEFFAGQLYFIACSDDRSSCELLRAPLVGGTAVEVAPVCDRSGCAPFDEALWVRGVGGRLVFTRETETEATVWTSAADGSAATQVATLCEAGSCFGPYVGPVVLGASVFFASVTGQGASRELWSSDGTSSGTLRLAGPLPVFDWRFPNAESSPLAALAGGGGWLFAAGDTDHGLELWRARPQADSGALVEDLRTDRPGLVNPEPVGTVDSTFVFALTAADGDMRTLYRHALGSEIVEPFLTVPVRHGRHGARNAPPTLRPAGNAWFFIENDLGDENPFAEQIWRYDPLSRDLRILFADDPQLSGIGARDDDLVPSGADFLFLGSSGPELHPAIYRLRPRSGRDCEADGPARPGGDRDRRQRWLLVPAGGCAAGRRRRSRAADAKGARRLPRRLHRPGRGARRWRPVRARLGVLWFGFGRRASPGARGRPWHPSAR